jgi:hypothetical protein
MNGTSWTSERLVCPCVRLLQSISLLSRENHSLTNHLYYQFNFTIPLTTPPGNYLMRFEQIYPTMSFNYSQWFINWYVNSVFFVPLSDCFERHSCSETATTPNYKEKTYG